jgi:C-8 sterol isomerase
MSGKNVANKEIAARAQSSGSSFPFFLTLLVATTAVLVGGFVFLDNPRHWVFDEKVLHQCAKRGIEKGKGNASATIAATIAEVKAKYPKYITTGREWIFNNAGGAMGSMTVLHASLTEYVIIFGSATGTEGHTGRFFSTDYFHILYGEQWAASADAFEKEVFKPGDQHVLPRGTSKQYRMPGTCFALEYARGNIPSMMPFGLFDTFFSTVDLVTLWQTVAVSAEDTIKYMLMGKF